MKHLLTAPRALSVDAVTASVEVNCASVIANLAEFWQGDVRPCRPLRGMGFTHAAEVVCNANVRRCVVQYSRHHAHPCVTAEGTDTYDAPGLYEALQRHYKGVWVPSRVDPALDFDHPDAFDAINARLVEFAVARNIKLDQNGDWVRGKARTRYVYSRESQCFVRLYEYNAYHGYGPACRLELEIKLKGREKRLRLAAMDPAQWVLMCPATVDVMQGLGIDVTRMVVQPGPAPPPSLDRDRAFLAASAWPALLRLVAHHQGSFDDACRDVLAYREETERVRALITGATM